jgi:hypothetical protein
VIVCGISTGFPVLFPTPGQITHVLLTRAPLYSGSCPPFLARLACVRHAASVDSEPGSNSQDFLMCLICSRFKSRIDSSIYCCTFSIFQRTGTALRPQTWREKNRLKLLGGVFNDRCPATNLSLGTSLNYRYREDGCQAPIFRFLSLGLDKSALEGAEYRPAHLSQS